MLNRENFYFLYFLTSTSIKASKQAWRKDVYFPEKNIYVKKIWFFFLQLFCSSRLNLNTKPINHWKSPERISFPEDSSFSNPENILHFSCLFLKCMMFIFFRFPSDAGEDWYLTPAGGEDLWAGGLLVSVCGLEHYRNPEEPKGLRTHRLWVNL